VPNRVTIAIVFRHHLAAVAWVCMCSIVQASGQDTSATTALDRKVAAAEESLRTGERQIAESRYRAALLEGWMLVGAIEANRGRLADARHAFERASVSAVENSDALLSLAIVQVQMGDPVPAVNTLSRMASASPGNIAIRRTLAQALIATGKPAEAVQELEEAHAAAPRDMELSFALASGYLQLKKPELAEPLFGQVTAARPVPQTYVLIGRTYRDAGYYDRARAALRRALQMDPRTRRAHYYLGTAAAMQEGGVQLDDAIAEFRQELKLAPGDPPTVLRLGMALAETRQYQEALPLLDSAVQGPSAPLDAFLYLGRCQLALGRPAEAVAIFRRALKAADSSRAAGAAPDDARLRLIHYQLATALRDTGAAAEADREFAEAQRLAEDRAATAREKLAHYMADSAEGTKPNALVLPLDVSGFQDLRPAALDRVATQVRATLARVYLNLGVMLAQANKFSRAAEVLEMAAEIDRVFPQVQYSLGVAYFNSQQYHKAAAAFTRALEQHADDPAPRRMLALSSLNAEDYPRAAELLRDDPMRASDPSLQYAYGLALVRSNRAQEARDIFSRVLAEHPDVPELNVVLGQVYAAQGDYDAAVKSLLRAIELKKDVLDAHATLGVIYLKQGRLAEAADALKAELAGQPADTKTRLTLATVLDLDGRSDEALAELRTIVAARPMFGEARYLLGKILLARGAAADALTHLEVAEKLSPDLANVHYQLGQAYQRLGRPELAAREFELFQRLKDKQRGGTP
jgi:tetratricopeptide (TPR) repeat protein